jgi:hypothetical protein
MVHVSALTIYWVTRFENARQHNLNDGMDKSAAFGFEHPCPINDPG